MEIHWPEMAQEIGSGESLEAGRLRGTTIRLGAQESGWRGVAVALRDGLGLRVADAEVDAEWMRSGCGVDAEWMRSGLQSERDCGGSVESIGGIDCAGGRQPPALLFCVGVAG